MKSPLSCRLKPSASPSQSQSQSASGVCGALDEGGKAVSAKRSAEADLRADLTALSQIDHANKITGLLWDGLCEWGITRKGGRG